MSPLREGIAVCGGQAQGFVVMVRNCVLCIPRDVCRQEVLTGDALGIIVVVLVGVER